MNTQKLEDPFKTGTIHFRPQYVPKSSTLRAPTQSGRGPSCRGGAQVGAAELPPVRLPPAINGRGGDYGPGGDHRRRSSGRRKFRRRANRRGGRQVSDPESLGELRPGSRKAGSFFPA